MGLTYAVDRVFSYRSMITEIPKWRKSRTTIKQAVYGKRRERNFAIKCEYVSPNAD